MVLHFAVSLWEGLLGRAGTINTTATNATTEVLLQLLLLLLLPPITLTNSPHPSIEIKSILNSTLKSTQLKSTQLNSRHRPQVLSPAALTQPLSFQDLHVTSFAAWTAFNGGYRGGRTTPQVS